MKFEITKLTPELYDKFNNFAENYITCKECKQIGLTHHCSRLFLCPHCGQYNEFDKKQILDFLNYAFDNSLID